MDDAEVHWRTRWAHAYEWARARAGLAWFLVGITLIANYMITVHREQSRSACQATYNAAFSQQLLARSALSDRAGAAINTLVLRVGSFIASPPPRTSAGRVAQQQAYRQAFVDYAAESAAIKAERSAHPLPALPDC